MLPDLDLCGWPTLTESWPPGVLLAIGHICRELALQYPKGLATIPGKVPAVTVLRTKISK
jgi:hypothetical protein